MKQFVERQQLVCMFYEQRLLNVSIIIRSITMLNLLSWSLATDHVPGYVLSCLLAQLQQFMRLHGLGQCRYDRVC